MAKRQIMSSAHRVVKVNRSILHRGGARVCLVVQAAVLVVWTLAVPVNPLVVVALTVPLMTMAQVFLIGHASVVIARSVRSSAEAWAWLGPVRWRLAGLSAAGGLAVVAGLALGVVPGVLLAVLLAVAVPVFVLERTTVGQALARSRTLLRGSWWRTTALLVGVAVLAALFLVAVNYTVNPLYQHLDAAANLDATAFPLLLLVTASAVLPSAVTLPHVAVVVALVHVDLDTTARTAHPTRSGGTP